MTIKDNTTVYGKDIIVGVPLDLGTYTLSHEDLTKFAAQWDPQYFHTDSKAAEVGYYGGIIASGIQTLAIFQRLAVMAQFNTWAIIAGRGMQGLSFPRPVRPGDVLRGELMVTSLTPDSKGRAHLVFWGCLLNQDGKKVLTLEMETLMYMTQEDRPSTMGLG